MTDLPYMFYDCSSILYLRDISKWNIETVTRLNSMFERCLSLSSLHFFSKLNTNIVSRNIFARCHNLIISDRIKANSNSSNSNNQQNRRKKKIKIIN